MNLTKPDGRENHGWEVEKSLLMDGSHHRPEINLQKVRILFKSGIPKAASLLLQVVFNRDNILSLFDF